MADKIELGDLVKDRVTGFTGIAIAQTRWLNNCDRWTVQPRELKDGKPIEASTFDINDLVIVEKNALAEKPKKTGGPMASPTRRHSPTR